jgi:hypothetical protein
MLLYIYLLFRTAVDSLHRVTYLVRAVLYPELDGVGRYVECCSRAVRYAERTGTGVVGTLKNLIMQECRLNFKCRRVVIYCNDECWYRKYSSSEPW